jgi:formiminoglutamase
VDSVWREPDMSLWSGRRDGDEAEHRRWHQVVQIMPAQADLRGSEVILGFACEEGVRRNQGRVGAAAGPGALRRALANLPRPQRADLFDAGDVECTDGDLDTAQRCLADRVAGILRRSGRPVLLGGGHEIAWASFQGLSATVPADATLGIINFDAHFDLRDPAPEPSSGTPFRQIADLCDREGRAFNYQVLGVNPLANTPALFDHARQRKVQWFEDQECTYSELPRLQTALEAFIEPCEYLYLTLCLDAFPAGIAPGVSAPGAPGMCPRTAIVLLRHIRAACERFHTTLALVDVAEMNPAFDRDGITARWAARLLGEVLA